MLEMIKTKLASIRVPYLGTDLGKLITKCEMNDDKLYLNIILPFPAHQMQPTLAEKIKTILTDFPSCEIDFQTRVDSHVIQNNVPAVDNIKNIIAVASGKGGVGKSTTAVNLALAMRAQGARVGLLDADIYGPSVPKMLGAGRRPSSEDGKRLDPLICYGVQSMSMGYLIEEDTPMVWRGPMVSRALQQLLNDTAWDDLDYLFIDLPPGTGDIQLTLAQKIPVTGAIIVTTPQDMALLDARKAIGMFEKVNIPVIGIVENMATHICSACGHEDAIFGAGGGASIAAQYKVELLGALPLDKRIREQTDGGEPTVVAEPEGELAKVYYDIACKSAAKIALTKKNYAKKFPKIVVE